jgi:hypothetical protein
MEKNNLTNESNIQYEGGGISKKFTMGGKNIRRNTIAKSYLEIMSSNKKKRLSARNDS